MQGQTEDLALFALTMTPGFSWAQTKSELQELGSPSAVLRSRFQDQLLDGSEEAIASARSLIARYSARGIRTATSASDAYPRQLLSVHDAPPVLHWQGEMRESDAEAVAIVGTRQPDARGEQFARELGGKLADNGIPVISGLARGIDAAAMRASIAHGGRTIGVIGTGLGVYYPREHRSLQDEIAANHLLISQFPPGANATRRTFPMRNVVMSGFASATVIVQAGETSGTRIQANAAVRHGRPVVIARDVVDRASWAQDLIARAFDVVVVDDSSDAFEALQEIRRRRSDAALEFDLSALLRE